MQEIRKDIGQLVLSQCIFQFFLGLSFCTYIYNLAYSTTVQKSSVCEAFGFIFVFLYFFTLNLTSCIAIEIYLKLKKFSSDLTSKRYFLYFIFSAVLALISDIVLLILSVIGNTEYGTCFIKNKEDSSFASLIPSCLHLPFMVFLLFKTLKLIQQNSDLKILSILITNFTFMLTHMIGVCFNAYFASSQSKDVEILYIGAIFTAFSGFVLCATRLFSKSLVVKIKEKFCKKNHSIDVDEYSSDAYNDLAKQLKGPSWDLGFLLDSLAKKMISEILIMLYVAYSAKYPISNEKKIKYVYKEEAYADIETIYPFIRDGI